jgi:hypothetical protein
LEASDNLWEEIENVKDTRREWEKSVLGTRFPATAVFLKYTPEGK